jgi:hypothetical protein
LFRARLRELEAVKLKVHTDYVAYLYTGFADNRQGYLYVRAGKPPAFGTRELFSGELVALWPLGNGWYRFATS